MLNVEYIKEEKLTRAIVNGIYDKDSFKLDYTDDVSVNIYDKRIIELLMCEEIQEILTHFDDIDIPMLEEYYPVTISDKDWSYITLRRKGEKGFIIEFRFQYDTEEWRNSYSIKEFGNKMEWLCSYNNYSFEYEQQDELITNGFYLWSFLIDKKSTLKEILDKFIPKIKLLFSEVVKTLTIKLEVNCLDIVFNVDENIKTACQQYLVYFSQFLQDIGIEANSSMSEEAQKIMFSVTPCDSDVALTRIKNALEVYLDLPRYPEMISNCNVDEVAVIQLQSNIHHLNSQLALAKATIAANNKTIRLLELISNRELLTNMDDNKEELLDGILKIKEYKKNGFEIDVPELIRKMKRKFG